MKRDSSTLHVVTISLIATIVPCLTSIQEQTSSLTEGLPETECGEAILHV